jgi:hypothetical protein
VLLFAGDAVALFKFLYFVAQVVFGQEFDDAFKFVVPAVVPDKFAVEGMGMHGLELVAEEHGGVAFGIVAQVGLHFFGCAVAENAPGMRKRSFIALVAGGKDGGDFAGKLGKLVVGKLVELSLMTVYMYV